MTARPFVTQLDIDSSTQPVRVSIKGDWVLAHYRVLEPVVTQFRASQPQSVVFDLTQLGALDTAGATLLALLLGMNASIICANLRLNCPKNAALYWKPLAVFYLI